MKSLLIFALMGLGVQTFAEGTIPAHGMSCIAEDGARISMTPIDDLRIDVEVTTGDGLILDDNSYGLITKDATSLFYGDNGQSGVWITVSGLAEESLEQATVVYENDLLDETLYFAGCQAQ